jgi:ABC-type Fe3+-hydroxamate transport system substrate-binding protein
MREKERAAGVDRLEYYDSFKRQVEETKRKLLDLLIEVRTQGKTVVGYGAPGKGNTLLNYCGIGTDFIDFTVDRNPYKQGKYTPGTRIPILPPEQLTKARPDYVLILPWNLKDEILATVGKTPGLNARFVVPIPKVEIVG